MIESDSVAPRRWPRRLILIALVFGVGFATLAMSRTPQADPFRLPVPNGYDDLVKAGSLREGAWPHKTDLGKATIDEIRPYVETNRKVLELARVGLGRECIVSIEDSQEGLNKHLDQISKIRDVHRLFDLEGRVLVADGRFAEAAKIYREALELGQVITQGGMAADGQLGWVLQEQTIRRLREFRRKIPVDEARTLLIDLDLLDHRRVTLQALEDRWARWYRGAFNPLIRAMMRANGLEAKGKTDQAGVAKKGLDKIERAMRYFQLELAIDLFHEDQKSWPRSVGELVPKYLSAVPVDANTGQPLEYPANQAGELTDDLSAIARPDGEVVKPKP